MSASLRIISLVVFLLLIAVYPIHSQKSRRGPVFRGSGGPTQLEIQVTGENSHNLNMQLSIELVSNSSRQMNNTTFTDSTGHAQFSVSGPGTYQVKVSGPNIEDTTSANIFIEQDETVHHEYVAVKLKPNVSNNHVPANEATVSAAQLNVPENARKEYSKGVEAMHNKDWKEAREHFDMATRDYDKFDWAYNALGVVCMASGDKASAHTAFAKAVEINDHNAGAERNLARIMIGEGDFAQAEAHARHSLMVEAQNADALTLEGLAQLKQGKFDDALASARRVHSSDKHAFPYSHLIAARALEAKQMKDQAAAEYRIYLAEAPDAPEAIVARDGLQRIGAK